MISFFSRSPKQQNLLQYRPIIPFPHPFQYHHRNHTVFSLKAPLLQKTHQFSSADTDLPTQQPTGRPAGGSTKILRSEAAVWFCVIFSPQRFRLRRCFFISRHPNMSFGLAILIAALLLPLLSAGSNPTVLHLERAVATTGPATNLTGHHLHLVQRDRARHGRFFKGVVNYTLGGDLSVGLYYTRLQLGTPPRNYNLQVDTGSDITWIGCVPCKYCPTSSGIPNISIHHYDPAASSTYSPMSCYEKHCPTRDRVADCSADAAHHCQYWVDYADKSHVAGYFVRELITYDRNVGNSQRVTSTAPFVFGCSTVASLYTLSTTDGILGLGHQGVSLISQLADQGLSPRVFSHCLRESGGVLVLGEVAEPDIIYSPMIPSQPHYNLDLQQISVNGQTLSINPRMLSASSGERGLLIDSGTTFMYLRTGALTRVLSAINASTSALAMQSRINFPCYLVTSSVAEAFPQISLHFAGGADLVLYPHDYLRYDGLVDGAQMWCTNFEPILDERQPPVIGDMVMRNRLFVYDLIGQRIGWKKYNCSAAAGIINPKQGRRSSNAASKSWMGSWLFLLILKWSLIWLA